MGRTLGVVVLTVATGLALACSVPADAVDEPADCRVTVHGYDGPCPLGALPAFFDDFRYESGRTSGSVADAPPGDMFGENVWMTENGPETSRAWYRFNRNNHPLTGSITFEDGVMRLLVPRGTRAEDFTRSLIIHTGATFEAGTYHYRVRLGPIWEGQRLRQSAWAMSPVHLVFESSNHQGRSRYEYWSELDFENQNHFQGSRETGQFVPDFVTMMSVGNHYGLLRSHPGSNQALSAVGPVPYMTGRGALVRDGFARHGTNRSAPQVSEWSERWLDLIIDVDPHTRESTYQMLAVESDQELRTVARRPVRIGEAFYPHRPMHFAFSLHWVQPEGRLQNDFWIDIDWIYYSPVSGLDAETIAEQVRYLRSREMSRINTTGRPIYHDHSVPLIANFDGPDTIQCGDLGSWTLLVNRAGVVHASTRQRTIKQNGVASMWEEILHPEVSVSPARNDARIEIEATVQDLWRPNGIDVDSESGWSYPSDENEAVTTSKTVSVVCPR